MERVTDEDLAKKAQLGDKQAEEELIKRYSGLVRQITKPYFLTDGDEDDLLQEGNIGLMGAISAYNGKSSFKTFATLCIRRNVDTAIKRSTSDKNKPLFDYLSLTNGGEEEPDPSIMVDPNAKSPEAEIIANESQSELFETLKKTLSDLEEKIFELYIKGFSYKEIGKKLNITAKTVDNALKRIRFKIKKITEGK